MTPLIAEARFDRRDPLAEVGKLAPQLFNGRRLGTGLDTGGALRPNSPQVVFGQPQSPRDACEGGPIAALVNAMLDLPERRHGDPGTLGKLPLCDPSFLHAVVDGLCHRYRVAH